MARGKKAAKELSPKEKLQQALVPAEEQPYPIPENWCWVRFDSVVDGFQYGYTEKATYEKVGPHFIRITDIGNGIIDNRSAPYCRIDAATYPKYKIHKNDIFIARMGSVGENGIALEDINAVFASYLIRVIPKISATLVIDYLQSPLYWGQITDKSQGTTRLNVNANVLKKLLFPLPPLSEQHRIVSRIESLFAKLDEAKEKAQAVVDGFELRKSAILHKAFTGELTERWRKEHGVGLDSWAKKRLKDTTIQIIDGDRGASYPKKQDFSSAGYCVFLNAKNVTKYGFKFEQVAFISKEKDEELRSGKLIRGDIILTTRGTIGNIAIYDSNVPYEHLRINSGMVIYRNGIEFCKPYIVWLFRSRDILDQIEKFQTGSAQPQLPIKIMKELLLPIPSIPEQLEIIRLLDHFINSEQQAKEAAEAVLSQIDTMKKAILARAFRGELGTNDPGEEWAGELLKKTL